MKISDKSINSSIDEFYGEDPETLDESIKYSEEYIEYTKILQSSSEKLDVLNQDAADFEVNTLAIIEDAFKIKNKRRSNMEMVLFVAISAVILSIYVAVGFLLGYKVLIISQVVLISLMPWVILPIAAVRSRRGDLNG